MENYKRVNKHAGYDYWAKRIGSAYQAVGRFGKKNNLKRERMKAKEDLIKDLNDYNEEEILDEF